MATKDETEKERAGSAAFILAVAALMEPDLRHAILRVIRRVVEGLTAREVAVAMRSRDLGDAYAKRLARTMEPMLHGAIQPVARDVAAAAIATPGNPSLGRTQFRTVMEYAEEYARQFSGLHITGITDESRLAIRQAITYAVQQGHTPGRLAGDLASQIGLNARQQAAVTNYRAGLMSAEKKMPKPRILAMTDLYAQTLKQQRAQTIARTEVMSALNAGRQALWDELLRAGEMSPHDQKEWVTADDERTCDSCGPMHLQRVPVSADFRVVVGGTARLLDQPPVHPNCRCVCVLV